MLEELGVTDRQETVYHALIDWPDADVDQLAARSGLTRAATARALAELQRNDLATRLRGRPARYRAVTPALALEVLLRQRAERLDKVRRGITELTARFESASRLGNSDDMVEIVHGNEAVHQRWLQLQRSAQHVVRVFDKPPYIDPGNPAEPGLLNKGVTYRTVYDRAALDVPGKLPGIWEAFEAGEECRVASDVPLKMFIADRRMALAPLREATDLDGAIVVHASSLLGALIALFESVWARAIPLQERSQPIADRVRLTDVQRRLLDLLDAGLADEAIARHLGLGYRTVQRRIRELMDLFGAKTRYQLGVQTARALIE
jgi:DNA-binding CsgD family transcriptional regulator/predicted transcriptional regulator